MKQSSKMTQKSGEDEQLANIYIKRNFNFDINNFIEVGAASSLDQYQKPEYKKQKNEIVVVRKSKTPAPYQKQLGAAKPPRVHSGLS